MIISGYEQILTRTLSNSAAVHVALSSHLSTKTKNLVKINVLYIRKKHFVIAKLPEVTQDQIK